MTPRVFARQFLDGHHDAGTKDVAGRNIHRMALGAVGILLLERRDLTERFFTRPSLEASDIDKVIFLVYTERRDEGTQDERSIDTLSVSRTMYQTLSCAIRSDDMPLLADCANDAGFFQKKISPQEMSDLLHGSLKTPLEAANLMGIAYFFDCLCAMKLISRRWQTALAYSGSITLQGKHKPQSRSNYSSALSRARSIGIFTHKDDIDILMKHIREKYAR